ncbi:TetR/AcrR family transcriptional regulator [Nocardia uniformis]|uniref:TetR/AcrR family transcriptional regulator n=1 Tax=Nocardia uniformis TaxID=53432 RepID=A0A849C8Q7_9NOCA|nr:TetR/AcrR family transcriptional regulator [Nocardia uniformis]NNH72750.1 TetR/AcrR family transcriptional regulator [Nocardia uniformis]
MTEPAKRGRGPGRPRDERNSERRRNELVAAAYRVFTTKGYAAATTADIAAEVGAGYGTFYRYFDSKRAILDAVFDYGIELLTVQLAGEVFDPEFAFDDENLTFESLVRAWTSAVDGLCDLAENDEQLVRVLLFELTGVDDELNARLLGLHALLAATVERFLARYVKAGVLRRDLDTVNVGWLLVTATLPPMLRTMQGADEDDRRRYVETVVATLGPGIRAESPAAN